MLLGVAGLACVERRAAVAAWPHRREKLPVRARLAPMRTQHRLTVNTM